MDLVANSARLALARILYYPYLLSHFLSRGRSLRRLHVGCGTNRFDGWINADIDPLADLIIFLQRRLPFPSRYLECIYSEHVLEHVSYRTAVTFFTEARRVLKPGGVIRVAMPDLDDLVDGYVRDWHRFDWVNWPQFSFIKTRAEMINIAFRWWGHQHLYNREELERALCEAGFSEIRFVSWGHSSVTDLCGLETRADSKLIAEAVNS
jgi:predicted SAM-dependent methyltransferase